MARPPVGASRPSGGRPLLVDAFIAGGIAGALSGLAEALMMQLEGTGSRGLDGAVVLMAASAEISVPVGVAVGVAIRILRMATPAGLWRGVDPRTAAGGVFGLGGRRPGPPAPPFPPLFWRL